VTTVACSEGVRQCPAPCLRPGRSIPDLGDRDGDLPLMAAAVEEALRRLDALPGSRTWRERSGPGPGTGQKFEPRLGGLRSASAWSRSFVLATRDGPRLLTPGLSLDRAPGAGGVSDRLTLTRLYRGLSCSALS
jgi:hypothetical protein